MDDEKPSENDLVIATQSRVLVVIKPDGALSYGPGYTPDEAASVFWEALARKRREAGEPNRARLATPEEVGQLEMEQRFNEWEPAMLALARADAANEIAQTQYNQLVASRTPDRLVKAQAKAAEADNRLNECAVALVVLARAHAVRKGLLTEVPAEMAPVEGVTPDPKKVLN
jgi:hypothetical protein